MIVRSRQTMKRIALLSALGAIILTRANHLEMRLHR